MNQQSGQFLTRGESWKRKDRESIPFGGATASFSGNPPLPLNNKLLAGYLAHEFLTRGTLFGQMYKPAQVPAEPISTSGSTETKRLRLSHSGEAEPIQRVKPEKESYAEVSCLLKSDGAHVGGLVNPTQLARWIQM